MDTNKLQNIGAINPTRAMRNMSFDLGMHNSNARTRSYLTRRGSIKKENPLPGFPNDNTSKQGNMVLNQSNEVEPPKKKLKTTSKDRKATMKNSYINGIKK